MGREETRQRKKSIKKAIALAEEERIRRIQAKKNIQNNTPPVVPEDANNLLNEFIDNLPANEEIKTDEKMSTTAAEKSKNKTKADEKVAASSKKKKNQKGQDPKNSTTQKN